MKSPHFFVLAGIIIASYSIPVFPNHAFATRMSGPNVLLDLSDTDTADKEPIQMQKKNSRSIIAQGFPSLSGKDTSPTFEFSLSSQWLDFGTLTPANPVKRSQNISITNTSAPSYSVIAFEKSPLTDEKTHVVIPDTTCDNGTCSEEKASLWDNILTYGFGFRCDNITRTSCPHDFANPLHYRQFADYTKKEQFQEIMTGETTKESTIQITYKVNISKTQPQGTYTTTITYLAIPGY